MLACFNLHVSEGVSIFRNTFNTAFGVSHRFVTLIKGCKVMDSFVLLASFEFQCMCMARRCRMPPVPGFSDCSWAECNVDKGWPVATRNAVECASLLLEGYFRALYVPLGGSKTHMESSTNKNTPSKSMKFYISMFSDKPPCMPLSFGIVERRCNHIAKGSRGFFFFHIFFLSLFFNFFLFHRLFLPLPLLSFSSTFSSFLGSVFSPVGLCNYLRLSFQPCWVM